MPAKKGLYANIHAKRKRIKAGSGETMRKAGAKGAPSAADFRRSAKPAKKKCCPCEKNQNRTVNHQGDNG